MAPTRQPTQQTKKQRGTKTVAVVGRPVRRLNLVSEVVQRLQCEILEGRCPSGMTLPSEGSLGEQFGVSRTVMREAMRTLASKGLIEVSQGRAARVREADPGIVVESFRTFLGRSVQSPLALLEVRRPLETTVAELAAQRATPAQVAALREANERLAAAQDLAGQVVADLEFHERLAEATGNSVFLLLQRTLAQLMKEYLLGTMSRIGSRRAIRSHTPIIDAIERGDSEAARRSMAKHLEMAEADVRRTSAS